MDNVLRRRGSKMLSKLISPPGAGALIGGMIGFFLGSVVGIAAFRTAMSGAVPFMLIGAALGSLIGDKLQQIGHDRAR